MAYPAPDHVGYFARTRAQKLACVDLESRRALTYAALNARAMQVSALLCEIFAKKGEAIQGTRVAVLSRNSSDIVCLYVACLRTGAILQPLNWRLAPAELAVLGRDGEPGLIVFEREFAAGADALAAACPNAVLLVLDSPGSENFEAALSQADTSGFHPVVPAHDGATTLLYTSGTTGAPKGVIITEANARATGVNYSLAANVGGDSVFLCDMPMFHTVGLFAVTRTVLQMGATLLISPRFDAEETVRRIADPGLGVTHYFCVPQMAQQMRQARTFDPAHFRSLTALQTGGAPLAEAVVRAWLDDSIMMIDGYGMSEAGTVLGMPPGDLGVLRAKAGAAGLPAVLTQLRIVDSEGRDVADNEIGEIWLRGPTITPGYWRNEAATAKAFADGWLKSGDAARRDRDGYVTLVDRWKDMFISGGENVYPAEVEAALLELEGVCEAAVFGAPDARWGETGVALIVCAPGAQLSIEDITAHCRGRLASYKTPRHLRVVESLPRTASGKLQKAALRADWIAESQEKPS